MKKKTVSEAQILIHDKSIEDIKQWISTHGVDRGTAAQIFGYIAAYDLDLGSIQLCNYGLTYSFAEFKEWMNTPKSEDKPIENEICFFWNDIKRWATIGVLVEVKTVEQTDPECETSINTQYFVDNAGNTWSNCKIFTTFAEYRALLNEETVEEKLRAFREEEAKKNKVS